MRTENAKKEHNIFSAPANANIQCNAKNMEKLKTQERHGNANSQPETSS